MNPFRNRRPILDPAEFIGRRAEVAAVWERLEASPPQCCSVVGDARSGKTSLLFHLAATGEAAERFAFAYVNAGPYADLGTFQSHGSLYFWRDVYRALAQTLPGAAELAALPEGGVAEAALVDMVYELRWRVEEVVRAHERTVVLMLDNVEGIARLPPHNSSFLRSLAQEPATAGRLVYLATSRLPVYRLYPPETWQEPSSFWSLFGEAIYLGGLDEAAAAALIGRAGAHDRAARFTADEARLVRRLAGSHPMLIAVVAAQLFDARAAQGGALGPEQRAEVAQRVADEAHSLCHSWWSGLRLVHPGAEAVLVELARGRQPGQPDTLAAAEELARRGVLERGDSGWQIAAELFARFVRQQAGQSDGAAAPATRSGAAPDVREAALPSFTHLEGQVYAYLAGRAGVVCDREAIKRAIWPDSPPSDSALQKIIERIRDKIEPDPKSPRLLIAVRGQGYMLRPEG